MHGSRYIGLLPDNLTHRAEARDFDLILRRCGAHMNGDFLTLHDAALASVAFNEERRRVGSL